MANYWKLFKKAKVFYFGLGKIKCPALGGEEITFDQRGFRHFLLKGRGKGKRPITDQIRRFKLLTRIYFLIENSSLLNGGENDGDKLLSLSYGKDKKEIKLVVLNDSKNKKYFISIMDHK
jgi:hypothetical protein